MSLCVCIYIPLRQSVVMCVSADAHRWLVRYRCPAALLLLHAALHAASAQHSTRLLALKLLRALMVFDDGADNGGSGQVTSGATESLRKVAAAALPSPFETLPAAAASETVAFMAVVASAYAHWLPQV